MQSEVTFARESALRTRFGATAMLLVAAIIWGFTFVVQKWVTQAGVTVSALTFTGVRFVLGAVVVVPLVRIEWRQATRAVTRGEWWGFALCGVFLFLASWLQQVGITHTSVSNAGFFTGIYVVLIPFLSWLWFRHRPHAMVWPAVALTMLGIWLLNGGSLTQFSTGDLWVIACSVFWALQITCVGVYAMRSGRPLLLACVQFATAGVIGVVPALWVSPQEFMQLHGIWRELLWTGVMSAGVAFTLQVVAQRHLQPAVAAIIMGSEMLFAALAGRLFLAEQLDRLQWLGGALIFLAIIAVEAIPQMNLYKDR